MLGHLHAGTGNVHVSATGNLLSARADGSMNVTGSAARLAAGGSIGQPAGTGFGPLDLTVGTLAASAGNVTLGSGGAGGVGAGGSGSVYLRESNALTLGTVLPVLINRVDLDQTAAVIGGGDAVLAGVVAGLGIEVDVLEGPLILSERVSALAGDMRLTAAGGEIRRDAAAGSIQAQALLVMARDDVLLTWPNAAAVSIEREELYASGANDVSILAGQAGGNFYFADTDNVTIGTVAGSSGITAGHIWVRAAEDLTLESAITVSRSSTHPVLHLPGVVLAADAVFRNTSELGGAAIADNGWGWLIYDDNPFNDISRLGGLIPQFRLFRTPYDQLPFPSVTARGNGYISTMPWSIVEPNFGGLLGSDSVLGDSSRTLVDTGGGSVARMAQGVERGPGIPAPTNVVPPDSWTVILDGNATGLPRPAAGGPLVVGSAADNAQGLSAPLGLRLIPNVPFRANLDEVLGQAELWSVNLANGQPLPDWLTVAELDGVRVLTGRAPMGFTGSVSVNILVRDRSDGFLKLITIELDASLELAGN